MRAAAPGVAFWKMGRRGYGYVGLSGGYGECYRLVSDLKVYDGVGSIIQLVLIPLGLEHTCAVPDNLRSGDEYKVGQLFEGFRGLHPCGRDDDTHRYLYVSLDLVAYRAGHHQVFFLCHDGFLSCRIIPN